MFGITYENWKNVCEMCFSISDGSKKAYLQWFPFWKLSKEDQKKISGQYFFNTYIKTGAFVFFPPVMSRAENYIQKADGSFRDSTLISPLLFLIVQAIGKTIFDFYTPERPIDFETFYAGNYYFDRALYSKDYDDFYKTINAWSETHKYFIKTDITGFFGNINVDRLITQVDSICNKKTTNISQTQLLLIKELLLYCGNGRFPLIENSVASSYLSTIVYLDQIDCRIHAFLKDTIKDITSFKMVRYVDDLYILFSSDKDIDSLTRVYNEIRNEYSSILKEYGLSLNTNKCCLKETVDINEDLKKSLYDDFYKGEDNYIPDLFADSFRLFIKEVESAVDNYQFTHEKYEALIQKYFTKDDIEYTAHETFNHLIYNNDDVWDDEVSETLIRIIEKDVSALSLDPKPMAVMVMRSGRDKAIRAMLASLFARHKENRWNSYDTTIAISYLIQSKFNHIDLLHLIEKREPELFLYYIRACKYSFINQVASRKSNLYIRYIGSDETACFLFFMFLSEKRKHNYLTAYAYYKNFFDRMSADMAFKAGVNKGKDKSPNYNRYFKEKDLKALYAIFTNSESIIGTAHKLRNSNPVDHASAELINKETTREDLRKSVIDLDGLIKQFAVANAKHLV